MRSETEQRLVNEMKRPMTSQGRRPIRHTSEENQELKPPVLAGEVVSSKRTTVIQMDQGHLTAGVESYAEFSDHNIFNSLETAPKDHTANILQKNQDELTSAYCLSTTRQDTKLVNVVSKIG